MIWQKEIFLLPRSKGFHLITDEVLKHIPELPEQGLLHLFIKHTSAGLTINENADETVRTDMNMSFDELVPEEQDFEHTDEGPDDMPAHIKSVLVGSSVTIPITAKRLNLGTWQGIYLGEFRERASSRRIVVTIFS